MATTLSSNTGNAGNMETTKRRRATSEESKYCHQCRRKRDAMASCKQMKKGKPCNMKFCAACLDNRYAEKEAEVMALENWACPKCRELCNCSVCRKRRGQQPTRFLANTAEAAGFSPVSELLQNRRSEVAEATNEDATTLIGSSGAS